MMQKYQGDISIISSKKVEEMSKDKVFTKLPIGGLVVAEGETTGHKHILVAEPRADIEIAQDQFGYFVKVNSGRAMLKHDKHAEIVLEPGISFIGSQWEYSEIEKLRKVQD